MTGRTLRLPHDQDVLSLRAAIREFTEQPLGLNDEVRILREEVEALRTELLPAVVALRGSLDALAEEFRRARGKR